MLGRLWFKDVDTLVYGFWWVTTWLYSVCRCLWCSASKVDGLACVWFSESFGLFTGRILVCLAGLLQVYCLFQDFEMVAQRPGSVGAFPKSVRSELEGAQRTALRHCSFQ